MVCIRLVHCTGNMASLTTEERLESWRKGGGQLARKNYNSENWE